MLSMSHAWPDLETLTARLTAALDDPTAPRRAVKVLERMPCAEASTFPIEVVTCSRAGEPPLRLCCKYAAGRDHNAHRHRGGVRYEANVYRRILQPGGISRPRFHGSYEGSDGDDWLLIEYLDDCVWLSRAEDSGAMAMAARWIGRFHAASEAVELRNLQCGLNVCDASYFRGWPRRTLEFSSQRPERHTWLAHLCGRFEQALGVLLEEPQSVIHGEYYPKNILYRLGKVYPIDWESAAIGPGAIDLAMLFHGWSPEVQTQCQREYTQARWPGGPPADFSRTLAMARLYLLFRWLGDRPDWTVCAEPEAFCELRDIGAALGWI